jgi:membrane protein YqaA with SNARE-associated domain
MGWMISVRDLFLGYGALGLIPLAFIDAGLLPLPEALDALVIILSMRTHSHMLVYALAATLGSVLGCVFLYYIAARGGHAFLERKIGKRSADRVRAQFEKYEFISLVAAALLPPPMPLKAFVLAAGVVEVNVVKFIAALVLGRAIRYIAAGYLAVVYGGRILVLLETQGPRFGVRLLAIVTVTALSFWLYQRVSARRRNLETKSAD